MKVDIDESAKRAFYDECRKETEKFDTIEEQRADIVRRYKMENERYWNIYGIRKEDMNNYDLVIDTTSISPEEVAKIIIDAYLNWIKK